MNEFVMGFSFCQSVQYPTLEGCADCEAVNFNQWANVDDGTCNYDSDDDGIPDSEEIVGCQDSLACDYDIAATDSGECFYAEEGYDCEGNITEYFIGMQAEGGIVFYVDETGQRGLVAAPNILFGNSIDQWGSQGFYPNCNNSNSVTTSFLVGFGLQNSIDILNQNCYNQDELYTVEAAFYYQNDGYTDWYLPSVNELYELVTNITPLTQIGGIPSSGGSWLWTSTATQEVCGTFNYCTYAMILSDNQTNNGYNNNLTNEGTFPIIPIRAVGNWIEGCTDESACNYNSEVNLPNSTLCEYPQLGYDCEGNITEYLVGMQAEGGIVFYVDETGHGLVAAMDDLSIGATDPNGYGFNGYEWGCYQQEVNGADGTSIGTGYQNTMDIVNQGCTTENGSISAAQAALNSDSEGYSDWYLPSKDELLEVYNTIGNIGSLEESGGFDDFYYWSSSEQSNHYAWYVRLVGGAISDNHKNETYKVRPIRSF
jgi:hypothetical protein